MKQKIYEHIRLICLYGAGFFILGLGVYLMVTSGLGAGPWDTVTFNVRDALNSTSLADFFNITAGKVSFMINITILIVVLLYRRKVEFLTMIIPMLLIASCIDFWGLYVFEGLIVHSLLVRFLLFGLGVIVIPFGLALIISTGYPAFVFDEMMIMFMEIFKTKRLALVRMSNELFAIILATIIGFSFGFGFGTVGFGSIVLAVSIGPILKFFLKIMKGRRVL